MFVIVILNLMLQIHYNVHVWFIELLVWDQKQDSVIQMIIAKGIHGKKFSGASLRNTLFSAVQFL